MELTREMIESIERFWNEAVRDISVYDNPDELAMFLNSEGIKGRPGVCNACPIAEYFIKRVVVKFPSIYDMRVTVSLMYSFLFVGTNVEFSMHSTVAMGEFIESFDRGFYKFLERTD